MLPIIPQPYHRKPTEDEFYALGTPPAVIQWFTRLQRAIFIRKKARTLGKSGAVLKVVDNTL